MGPSETQASAASQRKGYSRCYSGGGWGRAILGLFLSQIVPAPGVAGQETGLHLELEEVGEVPLPPGLFVMGGLLIDSLRAVVWGPSGLFRVGVGEFAQPLIAGDAMLIRGVRITNLDPEKPEVEVIDSDGRLFEVQGDGTALPTAVLQGEGEVVQAVPLGDRWLVHRKIGNETTPLVLLWSPRPDGRTPPESVTPPEGGWLPQLRLVSGKGAAFIQEMVHPFSVHLVTLWDSGLDLVKVLDGDLIRGSMVANAFPQENTVALPLVPLDAGYLYQLSNLASDARLMITLTAGFEIIRSVVVPAPIGFITASAKTQELLGVVDTGTPSVRFYRWRWSEGSWQSPEL